MEIGSKVPDFELHASGGQLFRSSAFAGHPYVRTPRIDRLAAEGTVISNFYVNSTVCSPSRAGYRPVMKAARLGEHTVLLT